MKKLVALLLILVLCSSLAACGSSGESTPTEPTKTLYTMNDFEKLLTTMPVFVQSTKYVVQDESHKALYPDMLQAIIKNNTSEDVKNAVVAFVAWDNNDLPVKIKGSIDFSDGAYIKEVNCNDINLVPGATYGETSGFEVDEACGIETFKAIVASYETFDGDTWSNPYYDEWCKLYEGKKLSGDLTVEVEVEDVSFAANQGTNGGENEAGNVQVETTAALSESELLDQIDAQQVKILSTKYVVQDENYKSLYPDMLQAVIKNNTSEDIKNAVVAFVAWDQNNLPVKIKGSIDFSDGAYIKKVNYNDINLVPGATYGESSGFEIDEACGIETFKAIVVSYETFDGDTWNNPYYNDWCTLYEGVKLQ